MASAVYSEPLASRLSISLEGEASSSPFPSPSSSFLPPPTPGAHEFAVKPAPAARNSRKTSLIHSPNSTIPQTNGDTMSHEEFKDSVDSTPHEQTNDRIRTGDTANNLQEEPAVHKQPPVNPPSVMFSTSDGESTLHDELGRRMPEQTNGHLPTLNNVHSDVIIHPEPALEQEDRSQASTADSQTLHPNIPPSSICKNDSLSPAPSSPMLTSPTTPTPYSFQHQPRLVPPDHLEPPLSPAVEQSTSSSTTPTILTSALPPEDNDGLPMTPDTRKSSTSSASTTTGKKESPSPSKIIIPDNLLDILASQSATPASGPSSPAFSTFSTSSRRSRPMSTSFAADPSLFSSRPAPPSPAMSRRVSGAPSLAASTGSRSRSSRPSSTTVSRANSKRMSTASSAAARSQAGSPVINPLRLSVSSQRSQGFQSPLPSPQNLSFGALAMSSTSPPIGMSPAIHVSVASPQQQRRITPSNVLAPASTSISIPPTPSTAVPVALPPVHIKVRDYGFPFSDPRHSGLGTDVPKANDVARLNRRLRRRVVSGYSTASVESSDGDGMEVDEEDDDDEIENIMRGGGGGAGSAYGRGLDSFTLGLGRMSWNAGRGGGSGGFWPHQQATAATVLAAASSFPSRDDFDRNFLDGDSDDDLEPEDEPEYINGTGDDDLQGGAGDDEEEMLYPGLYRAVYAFEPEGTAEMRLVEDQIVRVIGRGGGVGWAVVVDESATPGAAVDGEEPSLRHALVPESYLEPVRLDYEDDGLDGPAS